MLPAKTNAARGRPETRPDQVAASVIAARCDGVAIVSRRGCGPFPQPAAATGAWQLPIGGSVVSARRDYGVSTAPWSSQWPP
jgi:hypothetical protein